MPPTAPAETAPHPDTQGVLLTGDFLAATLNLAQREALATVAGAMAGGITVRATVTELEHITAPEPEVQQDEPEEALDLSDKAADEILSDYTLIHEENESGEIEQVADAFIRGLEALPEQNPETAIAAYTAFVRSDDKRHRDTIAASILHLTDASIPVTLDLWRELLTGEDRGVAGIARESLGIAAESKTLTSAQTLDLLRAYRAAHPAEAE